MSLPLKLRAKFLSALRLASLTYLLLSKPTHKTTAISLTIKVYLDGEHIPNIKEDVALLEMRFTDNNLDNSSGVAPDVLGMYCKYDATTQTLSLRQSLNLLDFPKKGAYDLSQLILGAEATVVEDTGKTDASGNPYFWLNKKNFDGDNLAEKNCLIRYINFKTFGETNTSNCQ